MSALKPYEPTTTHWDTARERDVDMQLDAEERGLDSREKLEADVQKHFSHRTSTAMWPPSANKTTDWLSVSMETVLGWLDRQAAITERDCRSASEPYEDAAARTIGDLRAALEETTRKRGRLQDEADELTDERDRLCRQVALKDSIIEGLRQSLDEIMAERNELAAQVEAKEQLERDSAYMRLPVDADGVPIRIGDKMEWTNSHNGEKERFVCAGYTTEYSTWTPDNLALMATNEESAEFYCDQCRHVQPDTVESLLEEFHGKLWSDDEEQMALLAEYAERIRKAVER